MTFRPASFIFKGPDANGRPEPLRRPPRPVPAAAFSTVVRANPFILASVAVRRTALDAVGGFDESLIPLGCEDWDLWLRITRRFPVVGVDEELTRYRCHPGNTAHDQILASGLAAIDRLYADPGVAAAAGLDHAAARARLLWYHAGAVARSRPATARALARRAWAASPRMLASRPAAGALARLLLPDALRRLLP